MVYAPHRMPFLWQDYLVRGSEEQAPTRLFDDLLADGESGGKGDESAAGGVTRAVAAARTGGGGGGAEASKSNSSFAIVRQGTSIISCHTSTFAQAAAGGDAGALWAPGVLNWWERRIGLPVRTRKVGHGGQGAISGLNEKRVTHASLATTQSGG